MAIVGIPVFLGVWIYSMFAWGFLIGLAIGWLPALIAAFILGFLWPLVLVAILLGVIFITIEGGW